MIRTPLSGQGLARDMLSSFVSMSVFTIIIGVAMDWNAALLSLIIGAIIYIIMKIIVW